MGLYLNKGNDLFEISVNDDIYVDKSELIACTNKVLGKRDRYICVSRPRRFGKSMAAEMLAGYYDKSCDSMLLFKDLKIAGNSEFKKNLNKYDVIFWEIQNIIAESDGIDNLVDYLKISLVKELKAKYSNYIHAGETKDNFKLQKEYLDFLKALFKDRVYVKLAYMTGILPIKKYGTHSALNMFTEFSMTDASELAEFVGFTENEVKSLCNEYNKEFSEVKRWYDGYVLEDGLHIYNPKSIISVMKSKRFKSFWTMTETYEALRIYFDLNLEGLKDTIITMLGGGHCPINIEKFQNDMTTFDTKDDVLTILVHLGYLGYIVCRN